jgi:uncharacterized protein YabE (DUF348 family)
MRKRLKQLHHKTRMAGRRHVRTIKHVAKKPLFTIPFVTFMVLIALAAIGLLVTTGGKPTERKKNPNVVVVSYDKKERTIPTDAKTVGQLLKRLEIKLNEGDIVEPSAKTEIVSDNFRINVYRAVPVTIVDGAHKTFTYSAASTPRSIARQAGVEVFPEDDLSLLPTDNFLTESSIGERVVIDRATPVFVNLYGAQATIRTHAKTVADLIKEKGIKIGKDDDVIPAKNTPLTTNTQVFFVRKGTQVQTAEQPIDMPLQTVSDDTLAYGTTAIRQQGAPGKKLVTFQVDLQNGQEVGRKVIQEVVVQQPVTQIVAKGTHALTVSLQTWLYKLRMCESHGNYQTNTGNGYYGAYQFSQSTWNRIAVQRMGVPYSRADLAPPEVQDQAIIVNTNLSSGGIASQNPGCYRSTGISAYPPSNH